jgi:hypothetical protein
MELGDSAPPTSCTEFVADGGYLLAPVDATSGLPLHHAAVVILLATLRRTHLPASPAPGSTSENAPNRWRTPRRRRQRRGRTVWPRRRRPNRLIELAAIVQRLARTMTTDSGWLNAAVPVLDGQRVVELNAGAV